MNERIRSIWTSARDSMASHVNNNTGFLHHLTEYDPHMESRKHPTIPQYALLWIWVGSFFVYLVRMSKYKFRSSRRDAILENGENTKSGTGENGDIRGAGEDRGNVTKTTEVVKVSEENRFTKLKAPASLNDFLLHVIQFGVIMLFFYYSDYIKVFPRSARTYNRDTFLFVVFLLFLVGTVFTTRTTSDKILNRDITEEWKGWMQVMFVWYHYFAAAEWYNWIRLYIAAYVWMTGFGNFSFFWIKKDYSFWRASKMLFRLNFLVLMICASVSNPYMLYYICPMHTYWFISVYAFMGIAPSWNDHRGKMIIKFAIYAVVNSIIFDIPGVAELVFYPLWPLLGFSDGKHAIMHEWAFRLGLDHWVCFIGMVCAYNYPYFEAFVKRIEQNGSLQMAQRWKELLIKFSISLPLFVSILLWYGYILGPLDKFKYNVLHPYTSFIPILIFIWFRNVFPILRTHYIHLFAELGKITLETYLSQLHAYLQSNAKELVSYIVGYPLLNFSFNTIVYLGISHTLFSLTTDLSAYLLPQDLKLFRWRATYAVLAMIAAFLLATISHTYISQIVPYL